MAAAYAVLFIQACKPSFPTSDLGNAVMFKTNLIATRIKAEGKYICGKNKEDVPGNLATKNKVGVRAKR